MGPKDRDYFMLRAEQERDAAAHSRGIVRQRHEELASAYRMRVSYMDRGLVGEQQSEEAARVPQITVAA
jgi:hypothetical protein